MLIVERSATLSSETHTRIGTSRVKEMLESGAQEVVLAFPFCLTMIQDGLAAQDGGIQAKDIAELLVEALDTND